MKENNTFNIFLSEHSFCKGDVLGLTTTKDESYEFIVLETPRKKWYKQLLQFISFGLYKAPYQYKVKLI